MPSIPLHPRPRASASTSRDETPNPLPQLLQTPSGLALLELQGTINLPTQVNPLVENDLAETSSDQDDLSIYETPIGKLLFPDHSPQNAMDDTKWMKRAYLYVGRYQRMTGEVKKLPKPLAVIRRRQPQGRDEAGASDELEIVEIVRYKLVFKNRPEPVNDV